MYDEIVERYYTVILNYCKYKMNNNKDAAEDITQEVFLALYKKQNKLRLSEDIRFWLYRAADLEIKHYIRNNPSYAPIDEYNELFTEDDYPETTDSSFDCLDSDEMALLTDYYNGDDKEDVAKAYKLNMNALYIRIHRIRKKLKQHLTESKIITD